MAILNRLAANLRAASLNPHLWWISRQSIVRRGAIQWIDELTEFSQLVSRLKPETVLEIGTAQGGLFWLLCRISSPRATLISLDLPPDGRHSGGQRRAIDLIPFKQQDQQVHALQGNSHDPKVFEAVRSLLGGGKLDLLYIDGDHTYEGARNDYEMYAPFVRSRGMIGFHDIAANSHGCEVRRFWCELSADPALKTYDIIRPGAIQYGGIGVVRVA